MKSKNRSIIDAHFHIWDAAVLTIPTLNMYKGQLKKKYTFADYQNAIDGIDITKSFYCEVDAIKEQHQKEADWIIKLCNDTSNQIAGATIAADLDSKDFANSIFPYAKQSVVKSVRHNLFAADPHITKSSRFIENTRLLAKLELTCNLVMPADKIMDGVALVNACPNTTFVIDHCGVCPILSDSKMRDHWRQGITEYAKLPNTVCKVSECGFTSPDYSWKVPDVVDIIHHCIASFGEERIIYGTNWPICEISGSIQRWLEALDLTLQDFPDHYADMLFSSNSMRYFNCK